MHAVEDVHAVQRLLVYDCLCRTIVNPLLRWYDGGGIYRHVDFTAVLSPGPVIAPWGVYAPSNVTGAITWAADGSPSADSALTPSVEIWNNASTAAVQPFTVGLKVIDADGKVGCFPKRSFL